LSDVAAVRQKKGPVGVKRDQYLIGPFVTALGREPDTKPVRFRLSEINGL